MTTRILIGDVRDQLKTLADDSVHCVVTSPPYFGLRDYGVAGQIGLEPTPAEFVAVTVEVFREVRRVLRPDGTVWLNLGDSYSSTKEGNTNGLGGSSLGASKGPGNRAGTARHGAVVSAANASRKSTIPPGLKPKDLIGIPWRVAFALQADGWYLRQDIIWSKPNPMPESVTDRCTKAHEYLFLLSKSARYHYDAEAIAEAAIYAGDVKTGLGSTKEFDDVRQATVPRGERTVGDTRNRRSVWTVATQPFKEAHFATFPPDLIEPCIKAGCPKDCCAKCGAPAVRLTERIDTGRTQKMADGWDTGEGSHGTVHRNGREKGERDVPVMASVTTGWSPSCSCDTGLARGTVLDPFGGAGTTALVADRLQRDAILIELNPEYAALAEQRIFGDSPLFAKVAAE